jgi:hypothetical protein
MMLETIEPNLGQAMRQLNRDIPNISTDAIYRGPFISGTLQSDPSPKGSLFARTEPLYCLESPTGKDGRCAGSVALEQLSVLHGRRGRASLA